jgi:hypothetical protein
MVQRILTPFPSMAPASKLLFLQECLLLGGHFWRFFYFFRFLLGMPTPLQTKILEFAKPPDPLTGMPKRVSYKGLSEVINKKGQKFRTPDNTSGNAECWDLLEEALKFAGAKTSQYFNGGPGINMSNLNYVWGREIRLKDVQPGDLIQFRNYECTIKKRDLIDVMNRDRIDMNHNERIDINELGKQWGADEIIFYQERSHHSAIAASNPGLGFLRVYEQNIPAFVF